MKEAFEEIDMNQMIKRKIENIINQLNKEKGCYYRFGSEKFGPFLYGYISWFRNCIQNTQLDKIFFFSRDGYMMQKAYCVLEKKLSLGVETQYVYFSRNSLRQALLWKCNGYEESLQYLSEARYISVAELLSYYGFTSEEGKKISAQEGLDYFEDLSFDMLHKNQRIKELYELIKDVIIQKSEKKYQYLLKYLKQIGMQGNCAIVDIGWHGSMQYYLEQFIKISGIEATIEGYYVGINSLKPIEGTVSGYLYEDGDLKLRKSVLCFLGVLEKLFQSIEGSTKGYDDEGNGLIVPLKAPYEYAGQQIVIQHIEDWQNGAMDFLNTISNEQVENEDLRDWAKPLLRMGKSPSLYEVTLFTFFYNTDGEKLFFLPQKQLIKYRPKEFIHAFSNSTWKTGFMKAAFKVPLPYFQIYKILRK